MAADRRTPESGSILVESLVALTLLSLLGASLLQFLSATSHAQELALGRLVATWTLRSEHERALHAATSMAAPSEGDEPASAVVGVHRMDLSRSTTSRVGAVPEGPCRVALGSTLMESIVTTSATRARGGEVMSSLIGSGSAPGHHGPAPIGPLVRATTPAGLPLAGVAVGVAGLGTSSSLTSGPTDATPITGSDGCASFFVPGAAAVTVDDEDLLDGWHLPLTGRTVAVVSASQSRIVHIEAVRGILIGVDVGPDDVRLPEQAERGALAWWVADDPRGGVIALDDRREVGPGTVEVVVGTCPGGGASGSRARAAVGAGLPSVVRVDLARVEVVLDRSVPGLRIEATRDRDCPGTSGLRPTLTWGVPSQEPHEAIPYAVPIALPAGPWRLRLLEGGDVVAGPVVVMAGVDGPVELRP